MLKLKRRADKRKYLYKREKLHLYKRGIIYLYEKRKYYIHVNKNLETRSLEVYFLNFGFNQNLELD